MIRAQALYRHGQYRGFRIEGHAGYAELGEDIVCAAVSALVINTVNSIESFTGDRFICDYEDGTVKGWEFDGKISPETKLLMDSLMLGLKSIQKTYGDEFLKVEER